MGRAPGAAAGLVTIATGLVAGYAGRVAGFAILGGGLVGLWSAARGVPRHGRALAATDAWLIAAALVGVRLVAATVEARTDARAWAELAARAEPMTIRAVARVESVRPRGETGWSARGTLSGCPPPCRGALVRWAGRDEAPSVGSRVSLDAALVAEPLRGAPGSRFPPIGLGPGARRGSLRDVRVRGVAPPRVPLVVIAEEHLGRRIEARFGALAPLLTALLLGERADLDHALSDAFAATGTLHLLAVSGLHVGFLAAMLAFALGIARTGPHARAAAATLILAGYVLMVGARPSAVRAGVMASLALVARAGERRVDIWHLWGAAAVAILAWRPGDVFDLGYALSFGSVAGLLALAGPVERALGGASRGVADTAPPPLARILGAGLAATTAATAATLPIQAAAFGWLAPVGFLLNPLVVPLVGVGLPLAWAALAADAIGLEIAADPLAHASGVTLGLVAALVSAVGVETAPSVPGPWGWAAGAALAAASAVVMARRRTTAALGVAALAMALLFAASPPRARGLEIVWLDVGQGDAIVIHFPDGATWLVDAGPADPFGDAGRRSVLPYLRRRGVRRLDRLVTTHPDLDHVGGAVSVVRGMRVATWSSAGPIDDSPAWLGLLAADGPAGAPRAERLMAGMRLAQGGARVDVLHPGADWVPSDPYAARYPANEASVVLLVGWRRCRALLTGDLGRPGETALVETLGDSLHAELLHAGHHGSRHSSSAGFLGRVRPRHVVVSAGSGNRHGHPHPEALERIARVGAAVWRTDRQGAVTARCGARGWHLSTGPAYLP